MGWFLPLLRRLGEVSRDTDGFLGAPGGTGGVLDFFLMGVAGRATSEEDEEEEEEEEEREEEEELRPICSSVNVYILHTFLSLSPSTARTFLITTAVVLGALVHPVDRPVSTECGAPPTDGELVAALALVA